MEIYKLGSLIRLAHPDNVIIKAIITAVQINVNDISYQVVYYNDKTRIAMWVSELEIELIENTPKIRIGFK